MEERIPAGLFPGAAMKGGGRFPSAREGRRKGAPESEEGEAGKVEVRLADIVRDPTYQVRKRLNWGTVTLYAKAMRAGQEFPPMKVGLVGGTLVLLDGWHRMEAMEEIGLRWATVEVLEITAKEARWIAAEANMKHGLALTPAERREAFRVFVRAGLHREGSRFRSLRDIGRDFGVSASTVQRWMLRYFPRIAKRMAVDTMDTTNSARAPTPSEEGDRSMPDTPNAVPAPAAHPDDDVPDHPKRAEMEAIARDERLSPETRERARKALTQMVRWEVLNAAILIQQARAKTRT